MRSWRRIEIDFRKREKPPAAPETFWRGLVAENGSKGRIENGSKGRSGSSLAPSSWRDVGLFGGFDSAIPRAHSSLDSCSSRSARAARSRTTSRGTMPLPPVRECPDTCVPETVWAVCAEVVWVASEAPPPEKSMMGARRPHRAAVVAAVRARERRDACAEASSSAVPTKLPTISALRGIARGEAGALSAGLEGLPHDAPTCAAPPKEEDAGPAEAAAYAPA
eukprot:CAMPEP_0180376620 /NCGR_PEP_ID=MMETSP0989-20121125/23538_1 /TAXON_ID=697907 /ORGANISM="non described non described, Strain CCMP2293" /LENGTH=221 /DNA_ID=CAMNT_0022374899 /DNA_START=191 /DNA_END=851 /DNA_ORIENTATION=-